jgi:serine/threonine protein kinase
MKCPQMLEKDVAYSGIDADIFALGTLLFQLVSNQKGFSKADDLFYKNIKDKNYDLFWTKMILKREDLSKEFKNLYVRMIAYEPKERPSIKEVLNDPWFDEINVLIQYDPEGYKKLENEYKDYMYALELKYKDMIQLEIQNNPNHEQNDGNRGTRGISDFEGEQYFEENLIPKKLDKNNNYKYFAKIKGIFNPVKFMNLLMNEIIQKNKDECTLKKYDEKLKFKIIFEKEEDADEQKNEELEQNEEEDENNSGEKKCIMDVKIFDCENNEYLLCFNKKQGDSEEFYENFLKIKEIVQNIFN